MSFTTANELPAIIEPTITAGHPEIAEMTTLILDIQRVFLASLGDELAEDQISASQFFLLDQLQKEPGLSMTVIARRMGHSTAAATGLVDRLEKLGYVQRHHSEEDRRKVLVRVSDRGRQTVEKVQSGIAEKLGKMMTGLTERQVQKWLVIYRKVLANSTEA